MTKSWRRGRGRPKGDRPRTDLGTPEAQARRRLLAGAGDPVLAEYPLGMLLARGLIGREQHEAGCYYGFLYGRVVGRTQLSCAAIYDRLAAEVNAGRRAANEDEEKRHQDLFRLGKNRLLAASRRVCDATENLVVFGRLPRFLDLEGRRSAGARRGDAAELAAVLAGLDALVACYGPGAGRRGRMKCHKAASMMGAVANEAENVFSVAPNRKICQ